MADMLRALTSTLQGLSVHSAPPALKLVKFKGTPQSPGDLSLSEWLEDFDNYASRYGLQGKKKAQSLLEHLAGPAKEEILCRDSTIREDGDKIKDVLKSLFGTSSTVPQLSALLHSRTQEEGESLADFSRALMRLHSRMEVAAENPEDKDALGRLRDQSLKDRFVRGARERWVQRELRRIEMAFKGKPFLEMREEVLAFFQDQETATKGNARVRELAGDAGVHAVAATPRSTETDIRSEMNELKKEFAALRSTLQGIGGSPIGQQRRDFCYNCGKRGHLSSNCRDVKRCFKCGEEGHIKYNCPQASGPTAAPANPPQSLPRHHTRLTRAVWP